MKRDNLQDIEPGSEVYASLFRVAESLNLETGVKPFMCASCGQAFTLVQHYVEHFRSFPDPHYFPCSLCSTVFTDSTGLVNHDCQDPIYPLDNVPIEGLLPSYDLAAELDKKDTLNLNEILEDSRLGSKEVPDIESLSEEKATRTCHGCGKVFSSQKQLRFHERQFPDAHNFECNWCRKSFTSSNKLKKHLCVSPNPGESVLCSCLTTFSSSIEFRAHIGNKPHTCCSCSMIFKNVTNLIKHIRTHTQQRPFVCKECGKGFTQAANLRNHLSIHQGKNAAKCNLCPFSCKTPGGLFKHKKKHKEGREIRDLRKISTREFECSTCSKRFRFHRNLAMHMKAHSSDDSLCTQCGKLFSGKTKLSDHMRNCHGEQKVCAVCGKLVASAALLKAHKKIHVTKKDFTCYICFKSFAIKSYLMYHLKTHDETPKKYGCELCGKMFKVAASLKYHNRISCQKLNAL